MKIYGATDALPRPPARVLLAGTSGAGKTTAARRVAEILGAPFVEIDGLFHGPDWIKRPQFEADVERFSARPRWVTEWQYGEVRALLAERADTLVWLDLPRRVVMTRVVRRTLRRRRHRERLWNGNVEPALRTILTDPDHIIRWAWSTHTSNEARVVEAAGRNPGLTVVRLRTRRDVAAWINGPLAAAQR